MGANRLFLIALLLGPMTLPAQVNRYVVTFKDKNGSPFSVNESQQFLSTRAIQRRAKQGIAITENDFPVNPEYVRQLGSTGATVYFTSRWMNAALVQTTPQIMALVNALPFVSKSELVAPGTRLTGGRIRKIKNRKESGIAPATLSQLSMLGIDAMHTEGIRGEGVWVAVFDSGFEGVNTAAPFSHLFADNRVNMTFDFVGNSDQVFRYDDHGTEVFSVMAASSSSYTGGAPGATFQLFVTEDVSSEYRIEEYNWLFAAEQADSAGADVIQSSLGYNTFDDASMDYEKAELTGDVAIISQAARMAIDKGMVVVCSAGNEANNSWGLVTPPADVEGILSVGSVNSSFTRSAFSSRGPTSDNRVKPDVVALGSSTLVVSASGAISNSSGTSVAAPLVSSLVVGILQRYPDLSVEDVYDAITGSASQASNPDNEKGYGIPNYSDAIETLSGPGPEEEITIFPNPVNGGLIFVQLKTPGREVTISVHDLSGRELQHTSVLITWQNNPLRVDLSSLQPGIYLVTVKTTDNFKTERILKK